MKQAYENFTEIGEHFVKGECWTHSLSDHSPDDCFAWQHGVLEFAKWLDAVGLKIVANPEHYEKLWEMLRTHKPESFVAHCANTDVDKP